MPAIQCKATKANGERCTGYATEGSAFCFTHDPGRAAERTAARMRGGMNRKAGTSGTRPPSRVRTAADVYELLDFALAELDALENSVIRARAIIALADAYLKVISGNELEERITRLEQIAAGRINDRV